MWTPEVVTFRKFRMSKQKNWDPWGGGRAGARPLDPPMQRLPPVAPSLFLPSVTHDSQQACVQIDYYDDSLINALDLGLTPIEDGK